MAGKTREVRADLRVGILLGAMALTISLAWTLFVLRAPVPVDPPVHLEIRPGESVRQVARRLEDHGIVRSSTVLLVLARVEGADRHFRHGLHVFGGNMTPASVLEELARRPHKAGLVVTIPEGLTFSEIGGLLENRGIVTTAQYRDAACTPALLERMGAPADTNCLEGYLFPDTYAFTADMTATDVVEIQLRRFEQVMNSLIGSVMPSPSNALVDDGADPSIDAEGPRPGPTRIGEDMIHDVLVLASIIEKETGVHGERGLVSSVFHNRLRRGMRLQADPTAIYGAHAAGKEWDGRNLHKLLRQPSPYNTYTSDGLPPGPICNPGREAIAAAIAPHASEYVYFVADGEGAHSFSATLSEHNRAVAQLRDR